MKYLASIILAVLATTASAVVADDDKRDHSTTADVMKASGDAGSKVSRADLDTLAEKIGVKLKPGYIVAGVIKLDDGGNGVAALICEDVPSDAPMICAGNSHFVVLIYQQDQTKPLALVADIVVDEDEPAKPDAPAVP